MRIFKHAILTTVALAGLTDRLVFASPRVEFKKPLTSQLAVPNKRIHFASSAGSQASDALAACREVSGSPSQIDNAVMYLSDAPETSDVLLRAWARMEEDNVSQQEAIVSALEAHGSSEFGLLSCGLHSIQAKRTARESNRMLSAEMPPGMIEKEMKKVPDTAWIDRLRGEESKQRVSKKAESGDAQRRAGWQKQQADWKEMWAQRIHDLQVANNFNETEAKEARLRQRKERRQNKAANHHTKRVRYLPAEEAAKVKAKDDAWEAEKERQRADDEAKIDARKEDFRRQVQKAHEIIEKRKAATETENAEEDEMIAG